MKFYQSLSPELFPNVYTLAKRMAAVFGSTYICEQTFSRMKIVESKTRSRLTDQHLQDLLRLSTSNLTVEIDKLVAGKQPQLSN